MTRTIYFSIPLLAESEQLSKLLSCLKEQTYTHSHVVFCVNNPESWWKQEEKRLLCNDNQLCLKILNNVTGLKKTIIDCSSKGKGFSDKKSAVGWARKIAMDTIVERGNPDDIIISMDADTIFNSSYAQSVKTYFTDNPNTLALNTPYKHQLGDDKTLNKVMLRYEIYLRHYFLNLKRINSPYAFSALGSAMAFPVSTYRKVGGITPHRHGEDFYFLQKVAKSGSVGHKIDEIVYPSSRLSDRVGVGTGPALTKGLAGDWSSYPIFDPIYFDHIKETTDLFPKLYDKDCETPLTEFLKQQLNTEDLWGPLRKNFKTRDRFIRACHERLDGLRIFQYVKASHNELNSCESNILKKIYPDLEIYNEISLDDLSYGALKKINNDLFLFLYGLSSE